MTFVSRTALTGGTAAFPARTPDLQVDLPEGKLIEPLRLGLSTEGGDGRRGAFHKLLQVILDAHDDGLWLASLIDDKALFILFDALKNLPELSPGGQGRHNPGHGFCNHVSILSMPDQTN
jgi:hypothetical protein